MRNRENKFTESEGKQPFLTGGSATRDSSNEVTCPAEGIEDQLLCADMDCEGEEEEKYTTGPYKDCNCRNEECPNPWKYNLYCEDCGGAESAGKKSTCKGDSEYENESKGCPCQQVSDLDQCSHPSRRNDLAKLARAAAKRWEVAQESPYYLTAPVPSSTTQAKPPASESVTENGEGSEDTVEEIKNDSLKTDQLAEECPDPDKETLRCDECGGATLENKRIREPENDNQFKGCPCVGYGYPQRRKNLKQRRANFAALLKITYMSPAPSATPQPQEIVITVVLAGSVVSVLADSAGSAAALVNIMVPENAKEHDENKTCPNSEHQCTECNGKSSMCTAGSDVECKFKETTCPEDKSENQPICTKDDCQGKDGKCTVGQHKDCNCKEEKCSDITKNYFFCEDCGGATYDNKCKGDPEDDNDYIGCPCIPEVVNTPPYKRDRAAGRRHGAHIREIRASIMSPVATPAPTPQPQPPTSKPECDTMKESSVPWNVFSKTVYKSFCDTINGKNKNDPFAQIVDNKGNSIPIKSKAKAVVSGRTPPPNADIYAGYTFSLAWTGHDATCQVTDCNNAFYNISQSVCGHAASEQNVMAIQTRFDTGCGTFSYEVLPPPGSAFKDPLPANAKPEISQVCTEHSANTQFTVQQAKDAVAKFCAQDQPLPKNAEPIKQAYTMIDVRLQLSAQISASQVGCKAPNGMTDHLNKEDCSAHFMAGVHNCDTNTQNDKFGVKPLVWSSEFGCLDFNIYGERIKSELV